MAKRKRSERLSNTVASNTTTAASPSITAAGIEKRRSSGRIKPTTVDADPESNPAILNGPEALRASPDARDDSEQLLELNSSTKGQKNDQVTSATPKRRIAKVAQDAPVAEPSQGIKKESKTVISTSKTSMAFLDPEADGEDFDTDPEELSTALFRPPPVNSSYLPLPWKGRLGYACLNTYLRNANTPVFSSRTCRIASILENRHPLKDPSQPAHATKNRPDKDQPADIRRGQAFVEGLGLANARDIPKMLRWNDRYGIKFLRLSSEMFPFASHDLYGYKLAPFASEALAEAGRVAAELGHRLTTHPGQFTQLGSPRQQVITASIRDLKFHAELLSLLKLPEQQNRDAVMILHMGGIFGDKAATLDRFRENYSKLDQGIKDRLVLENDDVCYSVHDLLPICEELSIPLVLDFHHHNIVFDEDKIREGTHDIVDLFPRIKATWTRKRITQKMHYSEPTPAAITPRQRRKHNPRVSQLPPCASDMDLMIEAKDKEQAVFELMRTYKLPGYDTFNNLIPHTRNDENRPWKPPAKKKTPKKPKVEQEEVVVVEDEPKPPELVPEIDVSMGGPDGRVYWPPGMEEWLRPKKREVKKKDPDAEPTSVKLKKTPVKRAIIKTEPLDSPAQAEEATPAPKRRKAAPSVQTKPSTASDKKTKVTATTPVKKATSRTKELKTATSVLTPLTSEAEDESSLSDLSDESADADPPKRARAPATLAKRQSGRAAGKRVVSYAEGGDDEVE